MTHFNPPSPWWKSPAAVIAAGCLIGMIGFGMTVWTIVLSVFAVQANNNFSTGRAVAAVFIPLAIFLALLLALFAFIVIMILIALN